METVLLCSCLCFYNGQDSKPNEAAKVKMLTFIFSTVNNINNGVNINQCFDAVGWMAENTKNPTPGETFWANWTKWRILE